jgi:Domain of unknown function (DUF1772)
MAVDLMQFGIAQWFFGNVYEAVVKIPERLAADTRRTSLFGAGSPVRYYAPVVPVTAAATVGALITSSGGARRWLTVAAGCWFSGVVLTAYLVRTVNLKLFFGEEPAPATERDELIATWYRLNSPRIVAAGAALLAAQRGARPHRIGRPPVTQ